MERPAARIIRASGAAFCNSTPQPGNCIRQRSSPASPRQPVARGARPWPSRAHTAPVRRDRPGRRQSRHPWASGPAVAVLAPACRARQYPAHAAALPSLVRRRVHTEVPSGLATSGADGARRRHRKHLAAVPRAPGLSGASAPATYPPYEYRLPAGFTKREGIGIGDSGRTPGSCTEGLDHWPNESGAASAVRDGAVTGRVPPHRPPGGPFSTRPGLRGPCARATTEQTWGQNGHEKNDLER